MSSLKEMTGIKPKVEELLKGYVHLRDDDNKLIANIWYNEVTNLSDISAQKFLKIFSEGKLTSPESITRMRRKLQEENKEYRGENYSIRHKEEKNIKENISK